MPQGQVTFFDQFLVDAWKKLHDLSADDIRIAIITTAVTPLKTMSDPRWGAGGGTNLSSNQVTPGGNYPSGGSAVSNKSVTLVGGLAQFSFDPLAYASNASNPNNAGWGILYNNTDSGKRAIGFIDIGGLFDMTTGPLTFTAGASGAGQADQTP
jgi:hypothetical protein